MQFGFTLPAMAQTSGRSRAKAPPAGGGPAPDGDDGVEHGPGDDAGDGGSDEQLDGRPPVSGGADGAASNDGGVDEGSGDGEPRYSAQTLKEMARAYFRCSPHLVAGALSHEPSKSWTIAEARNEIESFRRREHGGESA